MPETYDDSGLRFLYPENWKLIERGDDEDTGGVTFELPSGGFFSIEPIRDGQLETELIEEIGDSIEEEYGQVERELVDAGTEQMTVDFQFYYLDLLIVSRVQIISIGPQSYYIQMQAESRDFEENSLVFQAILKQLADRN